MLDDVKKILAATLGLGERVNAFDEGTALIGAIPEFDSLAVVSVITAVEEHFDIVVDDDEISAETFETVGSLVDFVNSKVEA